MLYLAYGAASLTRKKVAPAATIAPSHFSTCYGNWSLYPFAEHASRFDFVQPLRFQRRLALPSIHLVK